MKLKGISDRGMKRLATRAATKEVRDNVKGLLEFCREQLSEEEIVDGLLGLMYAEEAQNFLEYLIQMYDLRRDSEDYED